MIKLLDYTTNPLTSMGQVAGIAYNARNPKRFQNIAKRCLEEGHGRVSEFADITIEISGYSAKMIRELYTHIAGTSRIQSSTRYIDYSNNFANIVPKTVSSNDEALSVWNNTIETISNAMSKLKELGVPVEDYTNLLPLAYDTTMVLKINVRSLINMFGVRLCTCAYWEYREFMKELKKLLSELNEEWKYLSDNYFVPKCITLGYCTERTRHCNLRPLKSEVLKEE